MKHWQYLDAKYIYSGVGLMIIPLMIRYRISWYHLIYANGNMPYGGMEIGSKSEIMNLFSESNCFLPHILLPKRDTLDENVGRCKVFMEKHSLAFPIIAKPDLGCVGFGVCVITSLKQLEELLSVSPVDYKVQEYCDYPEEYSIYYRRLPHEDFGKVTGVTLKTIPTVTGDGTSTIRELVQRDSRYTANRDALIQHVRKPDRILPLGVTEQVIVQGSHTYGSIFKDVSHLINDEMSGWVDKLAKNDPEFHIGRFDLRSKNRNALFSGEGVKILEVNGCMSEPIHMYDDKHSLWFGIKEFFTVYRWAFHIAAAKKPRRQSPPYIEMNKAFLRFFSSKREVMQKIG